MTSRDEILGWLADAHYAVLFTIIEGTTYADTMREICKSKGYKRMVAKSFGEMTIRRLMELSSKQEKQYVQYNIGEIVYASSNAAKIRSDFISMIAKRTSNITGASS